MCLYEAEIGAVVVGDMVATEGTILVAPGDGDMREYLAQLRRLEALGAEVALPAHGDPIDEPSKLFAHYVAHREMREQKVVAAVRAAAGATPEELLSVVYDDTPKIAWPWALLSLRAHLDKLVADGVVQLRDQRYSAE